METKVFLSDEYNVAVCEGGSCFNSPVYISLLSDGTENNIKLPQDIYDIYDGLGQGTRTLKTYFTTFEFKEKANVTITFPADVKSIEIKPETALNALEYADGILSFEVNKDTSFVIEPNGDIFGGLHVFCNKAKEIVKDKKNIIEFTKGLYTSENCDYIRINKYGVPIIDKIEDNTLIYIHDGALVNAAIELIGVKNVKIAGTGIISLIDRVHGAENNFSTDRMWGAFRYNAKPNLYIRSGCSNIEIDDVILNCEFRGVVIRNSEDISINNVKIFTSTENADGINCYNTSNLVVDGCYIQSADDCFCMYNSCDSIPTLDDKDYDNVNPVCRNVEVKNCVMSSNARPVVLGGHATGCKNPRCIIEDIYIHDCRIVETPYRIYGNTEEYSTYWSGFLRLLSQSEQIVRNIKFENIIIDVTEGHNGKPVHIEVRDSRNASYTENQGYRIEDISFKNITVRNHTDKLLPSLIKCRKPLDENDDCGISRISFENVTIGGDVITNEKIVCEGNVKSIKINK